MAEKIPWETQYKLAVDWVRYQDQRRWALLSVYLLVQGLGVQLFVRSVNEDLHSYVEAVAWGSVALAILWQVLLWRSNLYLRDRTIVAAYLEAGLYGARMYPRFYDEHAAIPEERARRQEVTKREPLLRRHTRTGSIMYLLVAVPAGVSIFMIGILHEVAWNPSQWNANSMWGLIPGLVIAISTAALSFYARPTIPQVTDLDVGWEPR